jgi:hypothetical protein
VDLREDEGRPLSDAGYRVERGTFGPLITVDKQPGYLPVPFTERLPHYQEQDIVIVDCAVPTATTVEDLEDPPSGEEWLWQRVGQGFLDPRPWSMRRHRGGLDRIHNHGGVFVCFTAPKYTEGYSWVESERDAIFTGDNCPMNTWEFLTLMDHVTVKQDQGQEIVADSLVEHISGLKSALEAASFFCTMEPDAWLKDRWAPLAKNKFGQTVAALIAPEDDSKQGVVFLLPRINDRAQFLKRLIQETIPRFAPDLFPHIRQGEWVRQEPYELPQIIELHSEIEQVEAEAKARAGALRGEIKKRRQEHGFLHELLTESDDALVTAIKKTLELLGFQDVRDVDEEAEDKRALREDLQVWDRESVLIGEVKGIGGLPRESDALQVTKYLTPRMKEWGRPTQGLMIVNHQLNVEGLKRERDNVFQSDVIVSADTYHVGLLTTWNLFRLARGYLRYGWKPEQVADLFYRHGVIEPIPSHFELVGTVNQFFEQAPALTINLTGEIKVGDTLAFELPVEFEQEQVGSLQLDSQPVEKAGPDVEIGLKTSLTKQQARKGTRVFKVAETLAAAT